MLRERFDLIGTHLSINANRTVITHNLSKHSVNVAHGSTIIDPHKPKSHIWTFKILQLNKDISDAIYIGINQWIVHKNISKFAGENNTPNYSYCCNGKLYSHETGNKGILIDSGIKFNDKYSIGDIICMKLEFNITKYGKLYFKKGMISAWKIAFDKIAKTNDKNKQLRMAIQLYGCHKGTSSIQLIGYETHQINIKTSIQPIYKSVQEQQIQQEQIYVIKQQLDSLYSSHKDLESLVEQKEQIIYPICKDTEFFELQKQSAIKVASCHYNMALLQMDIKQYNEAFDNLKKAIQLTPYNHKYLQKLKECEQINSQYIGRSQNKGINKHNGYWKCPSCVFVNSITDISCKMCANLQPEYVNSNSLPVSYSHNDKYISIQEQKAIRKKHIRKYVNKDIKPSTWICHACTFVNVKVDTLCKMCLTVASNDNDKAIQMLLDNCYVNEKKNDDIKLDDMNDKAENSFQTNLETEVSKYKKLYDENPNNLLDHFQYAIALNAAGYEQESETHFLQLFERYDTELWNVLQKDKINDALLFCKKLIEKHSQKASLYYNVGIILMKQGNYNEAVIYFETSLKLNNNSAECHYEFSVLLMEYLNQTNKAKIHLNEAIKICPNNNIYWNKLVTLQNIIINQENCEEKNDEYSSIESLNNQQKSNDNSIQKTISSSGKKSEPKSEILSMSKLMKAIKSKLKVRDNNTNTISSNIITSMNKTDENKVENNDNVNENIEIVYNNIDRNNIEIDENYFEQDVVVIDLKEDNDVELIMDTNNVYGKCNEGELELTDERQKEFKRFLGLCIPNGIEKYFKLFKDIGMNDIRYINVLDDDILKNDIEMTNVDRKLLMRKISDYNEDNNEFNNYLKKCNMYSKYQSVFEINGIASFWSFYYYVKVFNDMKKLIQNDSHANVLWNLALNEYEQMEGK